MIYEIVWDWLWHGLEEIWPRHCSLLQRLNQCNSSCVAWLNLWLTSGFWAKSELTGAILTTRWKVNNSWTLNIKSDLYIAQIEAVWSNDTLFKLFFLHRSIFTWFGINQKLLSKELLLKLLLLCLSLKKDIVNNKIIE